MIIYTAKLHRKRILVAFLILTCGFCAAFGGYHAFQTSQTVSAPSNSKHVKSNEARVAYLESFGWTVTPEPIAVEELRIPKEFDASFDEYLALQTAQGYDLQKYAAKKVKRYTYGITNYPTGDPAMQASLLVLKGNVIGAEIISPTDPTLIHGLTRPE